MTVLVLFDDSIQDYWQGESNRRKRHVKEAIWIRRTRGPSTEMPAAMSFHTFMMLSSNNTSTVISTEEVCLRGRWKSLQVKFNSLDVIEELRKCYKKPSKEMFKDRSTKSFWAPWLVVYSVMKSQGSVPICQKAYITIPCWKWDTCWSIPIILSSFNETMHLVWSNALCSSLVYWE